MNWKNWIAGLALAASLNAHVNAEQPKSATVDLQQTEVVANGKKPINRTEAMIKAPSLKSDAYVLWENQGNSDLYKLRVQALSIEYGILSAGASAQNVGKSNADSVNYLGPVLRVQGKPIKNLFGKADIRYFPKEDLIDVYAIADSKRCFADILGTYNTETEKTSIRYGIEIKIGKNFAIGPEAKQAGTINNLDEQYLGLRLKGKF